MIVLSLFDGMSCGQLALEKANIKVDKYYSSEIDKYAIKITQKNYPSTIQLGDIKQWKNWKIDKPNLIIGGSPCQGFSYAGKQLNFEDPRSALFFDFIDIKNYYNSKYFLLENVQMKKEYKNIITRYIGIEPMVINSNLFICQNRKRFYWTNLHISRLPEKSEWNNEYYQYRRVYMRKNKSGVCPTLTSNMDTGGHNVPLQKIIESGKTDRESSFCIDANYYKGGNLKAYYDKSRRQLIFEGEKYRKLTPIECERLQTIPDNYTEGVSNTQRYKMIGNGWTVDVIAHIFKSLKEK